MRGRPTDPTKLKKSQTRSRNPAKAKAKAVRKALAEAAGAVPLLAQVDAEAPAKPLKHASRNPIGRSRSGSVMLAALDLSDTITPEQRLVIERIGKTGFTARTAAEFWAFQLTQVQEMRSKGELLGKDYAQALSQLATAAARMAELGIRTGESSGPSAVNFQLNVNAAPVGPAYAAPPPGPSGDVIEVG